MNISTRPGLLELDRSAVMVRSVALGAPVIGLALLITSFFYVLPLGRYRISGIDSDFRIYDFMFIGYVLLFGSSLFPRLKALFSKKVLFFRWAMILIILVCLSLVITGVTSGLNAFLIGALRAFRFFMYLLTAGLILAAVDTPRKQWFLTIVFYVNIVVQMLLSLAQQVKLLPTFWPKYWLVSYGEMPVGTLSPHHKHIGVVMLLGIVLALTFFQASRSWLVKLLSLVLIGGMIAVTVFTVSRTSWLGLVGIMIAIIFRQRRKGIWLVIIICLSMYIMYQFAPQDFRLNLTTNFANVFTDRLDRLGFEGVVGDRLRIYESMPDAVINTPWILFAGTGFQNIGYVLGATGAHDNYLQALFELGIVGFIIYMVFLYRILSNLALSRNKAHGRFQYFFASNAWAGVVGVLATMLVGESLWAQYSMFTLSGQIMALVALGCAPVIWTFQSKGQVNNA